MNQNSNALRNDGLEAVEKNDMKRAIDCFKRALLIEPSDATLHNNLANAYKHQKEYAPAKTHYTEAIRLNSDYAEAHNNLASLLAQSGDYPSALEHYRIAVHCAPDFTLAHYNLGLLLLRHQKIEAAKTQFKNVITLNPNHLQAHFYLGTLALNDNALLDAEHHFKEALSINPEHVDTLVNLGVIALKRDEAQLAIDYFTKALALDEKNIDARHNLAATFIHHDRFENALTHYSTLLDYAPTQIEYQYNAGVAEMALGHLNKAQTHFETILKQQPNHFSSLINLAAIYTRLDNRDTAIHLLTQAHQINPDDAPCRFMLDALLGQQPNAGACPEYARNLFDNYALYYDQHLQQTLHYTLPQHLARMLHQLIQNPPLKHTLDLGCGTGLSGVVLQELSETLIGVDISGKMLSQSRAKNIYNELIESELVAFLQETQNTYDLIVSADVLPYLGELETLFQALTPKLSNHGLFIFNIEISENEPWQLQKSARFSHHPQYIHSLAQQHQLTVVRKEHITSRQQSGEDLLVIVYALQANQTT
jgi:predicted TPR repeat methyltransferase